MLNMLFEPLHNTLCLISFKLHNVIEQRNGRSRQAEKINLKEKWAFQCLFSKKLTFLQDKQQDLILSEELWLMSTVQDTKLEGTEKKLISFPCFNMPLITNAVFKSLLHLGGYTTEQFDTSGFIELLVMHIPLATIPLISLWPNIWSFSLGKSLGDEDNGDGIMKDGSRISWWLYKSWPEANLTPL